MDGVGEWTTTAVARGSRSLYGTGRNELVIDKEVRFAHSLRLLYSGFTAWLGFEVVVKRFGERIGVPAVMNTSLNLRGEPIVSSPTDAFSTFVRRGLDSLRIGSLLPDPQIGLRTAAGKWPDEVALVRNWALPKDVADHVAASDAANLGHLPRAPASIPTAFVVIPGRIRGL